jgi:CRISPR/Cas system CMR subunit Cmr6 (Cas7 group RAMP superfamily)
MLKELRTKYKPISKILDKNDEIDEKIKSEVKEFLGKLREVLKIKKNKDPTLFNKDLKILKSLIILDKIVFEEGATKEFEQALNEVLDSLMED